jgi:ABC-type glycerol-3-phosphate transport system permease component
MTETTGARRSLSARRLGYRGAVVIRHLLIFGIGVVTVLPIVWIAFTSFKAPAQVMSWPPSIIPERFTLTNYIRLFAQAPVARFFFNSVVLALLNVAFNVTFCTMAGYTLARRNFPGRKTLMMLVVAGLMVPVYVRLLPQLQLIRGLGLENTYLGLVLPTAATPLGVFLMRQFFIGTIPSEIEDSAQMDGCSDWGVLLRIVLPLAKPQMVTLSLLAVTWSLEDILWPLMIVNSVKMRPLPIGLMLFLNDTSREWGPVAALVTIMIVPVVAVFLVLQKYFVAGLFEGAVKA